MIDRRISETAEFRHWLEGIRSRGLDGPGMVNIRDGVIVGTDRPIACDGSYVHVDFLPSQGGTVFNAIAKDLCASAPDSDEDDIVSKKTDGRGNAAWSVAADGSAVFTRVDPQSIDASEPDLWPQPFFIEIDLFHLQVGVFRSDADRVDDLKGRGVEAVEHNASAFASAHMDTGADGKAWFSMVIKPHTTKATWAHECAHTADFIMGHLGIPTGAENTEVRAYLVGHLFAGLEDGIGGAA